jgi:hypothetical protein
VAVFIADVFVLITNDITYSFLESPREGRIFTGHNIHVVLVGFFQAPTVFPSSRLWPPDAITTRFNRTNPPILKWNFNFFAPAERARADFLEMR